MKKILFPLLVITYLVSPIPIKTASAQDKTPAAPENDSGSVICPPGVYTSEPSSCLPLGPSSTLTQESAVGLYPPTPQVDYNPDYNLNFVPYNYFRVTKEGTSSYSSLSDAENKSGALSQLGPGLVYVTYVDRAQTDSGVYYDLSNGTWIPGDGSRVTPAIFQGRAFSATPRTGFGWILMETRSKQRPDFSSDNPLVHHYARYNMVPIYASKVFNGVEWLMIGNQEWVEGRVVAAVMPSTTPPAGVTGGRWIDINLAEQTLTAYDNGQLVYATLISSGVPPFWTRPGLFQIYKKKDTEDMSGSFEADRSDFYSLQNVPWTMYFDKARALHGEYWHNFLGYPMSHGCVNLSIGDAAWL